jgi:hypothetical protein
MSASLGLLAGCARESVVFSPQALPSLVASQAVHYERTRDGRRVVEDGPISWVVVRSRPAEASREDAERFTAPFTARLVGQELQVADEARSVRHPLRDIQRIEVEFEAPDRSRALGMRGVGIALTSIGGAVLVGGLALITLVVAEPRSNADIVVVGGVPLIAVSTLFAGIGIPLWVVGGRRAAPGNIVLPYAVPVLTPARNGAALRWAF